MSINKDVKAWIFISGTAIDYPVLYSADKSEFYLNHNYKKQKSRYGSIFIDPTCENTINAKNIILHGHHMKDGSMFRVLKNYQDIDFFRNTWIWRFTCRVEGL